MSYPDSAIAAAALGLALCAGGACGQSSSTSPTPPSGNRDARAIDAPDDRPDDGPGAPLDVSWIHGSASCPDNTDPALQVFQLDSDTFILRQNKCIHYEAPFLYLLFGSERVLLQDTGATASASQLPVAATVQSIIDGWLARRGQPRGAVDIELVVTHSHGHGDHVAGDGQFSGLPSTTVVAAEVPALQDFFGIASWPAQIASYDLGGRVLDVIPIPGHQTAHIALYDRRTGILFTGDTLYPGRLYIRDFPAYKASVARLVSLADGNPIRYVLGTHIEMSSTPGVDYPVGTTYQPAEHPLELHESHLRELDAALRAMGETPVLQVHDSFIVYPL